MENQIEDDGAHLEQCWPVVWKTPRNTSYLMINH